MYKSGKTRSEIDEPYGVDEFMYFLEGGVTLTSSDGTVTESRYFLGQSWTSNSVDGCS